MLQRQCDMGGGSSEPGRRPLLEQLFAFMQERGSPINSMPTVSKNFIDLYALYTVVNEKGGLVEVCKASQPQKCFDFTEQYLQIGITVFV